MGQLPPLRPDVGRRAAVNRIDPLRDPRWADLVSRHPRSSVFHTVPWLQALRRTYGYEALAYTSSPAGAPLDDGLLLCDVRSWMTGRRLVSLPFSDHCEPLLTDVANLRPFVASLDEATLRYVEIRSRRELPATAGLCRSTEKYWLHHLDLQPDLASLYANLHKSSTQRKVQRAEREHLTCQAGRSDPLLDAFWRLLLLTRQRHRVPPQPRAWFRNLIEAFGDKLQIWVAWKGTTPVASILTIRHKDTLVYKYGCSDAQFHTLGGTQFLFWKAIQQAKDQGVSALDLGRTDWGASGLLRFKDGLGAQRSILTYTRYSLFPPSATPAFSTRVANVAKQAVPYLPSFLLRAAGTFLYRHAG